MNKQNVIVDWLKTEYIKSNNFNKDNSILFLHWRMQDWNSFDSILKILDEKKISFVSLSLPWFWWSDIPKKDFDIYDYTDFVNNFVNKIGLISPSVIWHSFGWRIWIILWSQYKINNLILIWSAWIKPKTSKVRLFIVKTWKVFFSIPWLKSVWNIIRKKIWSDDYISSWRLKNIFLKTINEDLQYLFPKIIIPTLLIWWSKDTQTPLEDAKIMHRNIKKSKIEIFEDSAHFVFQEKPIEISDLILKFVKNDI